uniref:Uncharacterized protein n=1 Tax=Oryza sativa subsp. japonica TaxID=39947 RepID=Q6K9J1_ORYSJ|nr:hypothetical protein [Oryza sativa Japonica Group]
MSLAGARARREGHRRRHWNATERERERERGRTGAWSGRVGWGGVALVGVEMGRARAQARRGVWRVAWLRRGIGSRLWCVCFVLFRVGLGRCTRGGGGGGACLLFVCSLAASAVRPLGFGVERSSHLVGLRLGFIFLPWATGSVL